LTTGSPPQAKLDFHMSDGAEGRGRTKKFRLRRLPKWFERRRRDDMGITGFVAAGGSAVASSATFL
jgi:hypothetical protein